MPIENVAGKRRRGQVNGIQNQISSIHESIVRTILTREPWLSITEIAKRFPNVRKEIIQNPESKISPELRSKLPTGEDPDNLRKTVRKHLLRMLDSQLARFAGGKYCLVDSGDSVKRKVSDLVPLMKHVQSSVEPQNWQFLAAEDCSIYRTYVDPATRRYDFDGFFLDHLSDFQSSFLYLDRILVDAVGRGCLRSEFYDPASHKLSMTLLRNGWTTHFKDTELLVWTFAISPSRLLRYLENEKGNEKLTKWLENNGQDILTRGRKRLAETRAMDRKLKKMDVLRKKMIDDANAANASRSESS